MQADDLGRIKINRNYTHTHTHTQTKKNISLSILSGRHKKKIHNQQNKQIVKKK